MKKSILYFFAGITRFFFSCQSGKENVERVSNLGYETVVDDITSRMPGSIFYQDGLVYWHDALSSTNFIRVVNVFDGQELCSFGNVGSGPEEFTNPLLSLYPDGGFYLNDGNKSIENLYRLDRSVDSLHVLKSVYTSIPHATRMLHMKENTRFYLCPGEEKMFITVQKGNYYRDGVCPISEEASNKYDIVQGNVLYNSANGKLVYSAIRIPYMAVYDWTSDGWRLDKELKSSFDYIMSDGEIKLSKKSSGAMELALTKDYIVLLQRDKEVEGEALAPKYPRDMSVLPRSLFIYDYDLELKKIVNMPFAMLRLCGDDNGNYIYAIAANPDFSIIRIDLSEL